MDKSNKGLSGLLVLFTFPCPGVRGLRALSSSKPLKPLKKAYPYLKLRLFFKGKQCYCSLWVPSFMEQQEELNATLFHTYVYLVKAGKPVGPRDLMRGAHLSSPSVAYRNLQRLIDLGLAAKDEYGNYIVKEKVGLKGYVWVGKALVPRFVIFGFIFIGVLIAEIAVLIPHLLAGSMVEGSFWLLTVVTVVSAMIFLVEGLRFRNKTKQQSSKA